jgi:hypothetical protein
MKDVVVGMSHGNLLPNESTFNFLWSEPFEMKFRGFRAPDSFPLLIHALFCRVTLALYF